MGELSGGLVIEAIKRTMFDDEGETGNVNVDTST